MVGLQSTSKSASAVMDTKEIIVKKVDVCTFFARNKTKNVL